MNSSWCRLFSLVARARRSSHLRHCSQSSEPARSPGSSSSSLSRTTEWNGEGDAHSERVSVQVLVTPQMVAEFARISGDTNPLHVDASAASVSGLAAPAHCDGRATVVHGALLNALVSSVMGTRLPGPGTVVCSQQFRFPAPCWTGESVCVSVRLRSRRRLAGRMTVADFQLSLPQRGDCVVMEGSATLLLPKHHNKQSGGNPSSDDSASSG